MAKTLQIEMLLGNFPSFIGIEMRVIHIFLFVSFKIIQNSLPYCLDFIKT